MKEDASLRSPATVEDKSRSGHQRGSIRGEEYDAASHFFELTEAAKLDFCEHLLAECLVLKVWPCHRRFQKRGSEAVDPDVVGCKLDGHRLGEALDGVFARAIDGPARSAHMPHLRGDIDDGPTAANFYESPGNGLGYEICSAD